MNFLPSNESTWLTQNKNVYLYGTEAPDNSHASFQGHSGYGDTTKHHNYYSGTTCTDDAASSRAQEEYQHALDSLRNKDYAVAAWYAGAMTHYIADLAVFGHVMTNEVHHSDYEDQVNAVTSTYSDATFTITFDGTLETTSAYDASKSLGLDTWADGGGTYTASWMDANFQGSSVSSWTTEYRSRTNELLNLAINLIAATLHTLTVESGQPVTPWLPIFAAFSVIAVVAIVYVRHRAIGKKCRKCGEETHTTETTHSTKRDVYKLAVELGLAHRTSTSGEELADLAASYYGKRVILVQRGSHRAAWLFYPNLTMIHDAQPKPIRLVFPNGFTIWRTDRADDKPLNAKEYSVSKLPGRSEGRTKCNSCGAEITINNFKKRVTCPGCGKRYEIIVDDKEWTWVWGTPGHTQFAAKIKESGSGPRRQASSD